MEEIYLWGIQVIKAVQSIANPFLTTIVKSISFLGAFTIYVALISIFYWCIDEKKGFKIGFVLMFSNCINAVIKNNLKVPRPYTKEPSIQLSTENSYSTPSNHSQSAASFFTTFAFSAGSFSKLVKILFIFLVPFVIGFTRIYLGVHYPSDVIIGLIFGYLISIGFLFFEKPIADFCNRLRYTVKILIVALITFVFLFFCKENNTADFGMFFGFVTGYILLKEKTDFSAKQGSTKQKVLRFFIGLALTGLVYLLLKFLLPGKESIHYNLFAFVRYAIVTFFMSFIAPFIFAKMKLSVFSTTKDKEEGR